MALIKCPECGKEISDKSDKCIHCGFPLTKTKNKICIINGKEYDLSFVLDFYKDHPDEKVKLIGTFRRMTNCGLKDAKDVIDKILETNEIPKVLILKQQESSKPKEEYNKPKCPTCGSTNLSKVSTMSKAGSVFMWGLFSQKVKKTWHCNNCKYEW
ncbi:zinc-ribbon domain-containing protein [Butyribacter intestini]|uniref:zinc-ribbon domain-containing protein n=1 Tax=Butyribacter intestini TaxID=1703332 RepID=UPI003AEFF916